MPSIFHIINPRRLGRRITTAILAVLILALLIGGFLYIRDLQSTNAAVASSLTAANQEIAQLQRDKAETETRLSTAYQENEDLQTSKAEVETSLVTVSQQVADLQVVIADVEAKLTAANQEVTDLQTRSSQAESDLATANQQAADLRIGKLAVEVELSTVNQEVADLRSGKAQAESDLAAANQRLQQMDSSGQTYEALRAQIDALHVEISDLQEQRKALVPTMTVTGFHCTGSMEPAITCLDRATLLTNPKPSEVIPGAVISFARPSTCVLDADYVLHRVVRRQHMRGQMHYWTKGDNNPEEDNCWIPHNFVRGMIVAIDQNATPENAFLRDSVNAVVSRLTEARENHEAALQIYDDYCQRWTTASGKCELPQGRFATGLQMHDTVETARQLVLTLTDYADCWLAVARDDRYYPNYPGIRLPIACAALHGTPVPQP